MSALQRLNGDDDYNDGSTDTMLMSTKIPQRSPYFCAGCPHNLSTKLPDNSVASAGIGCHTLAMNLKRAKTMMYTHMGNRYN